MSGSSGWPRSASLDAVTAPQPPPESPESPESPEPPEPPQASEPADDSAREPAQTQEPAQTRPLPAVPERFRPGRAAPVTRPVTRFDPESDLDYPVTSPYPQPAYPAQWPYGGYVPPVGPPTNGLAVGSLVCSVAGLILCLVTCGLISLVGALLGHAARRQIRERHEAGDGMALAGIIMGWIGVGLALLPCAFYLVVILGAAGGELPNQQ